MISRDKTDKFISAFCDLMGRHYFGASFLDRIASWVLPRPFTPPALAGPALAGSDVASPNWTRPLLMSGVSGGDIAYEGTTPPRAATRSHRDPPGHSAAPCAPLKYHGMHGRPCKYVSGRDDYCPIGAEVGWFWKYETPVGVIYYVDCCGIRTAIRVWCNWSKENNWCLGKGGNFYTCSLALTKAELHMTSSNWPDPLYHVLSGPPAPGTAAPPGP